MTDKNDATPAQVPGYWRFINFIQSSSGILAAPRPGGVLTGIGRRGQGLPSRRAARTVAAQSSLLVASSKRSSSQPVIPPAMIFTGRPSSARRSAPRAAPLQCGPAQ